MINLTKDLSFNSQYKYMAYIVKDLCLYKIKQIQPLLRPKKSAFLVINYVNKLV